MKTARFIDSQKEVRNYAEFFFNVRSALIHKYCLRDGYETTIKAMIDNVLATSPSTLLGDYLEKKNPGDTAEYLETYIEILLEPDVPTTSPL